MAPVSASSFRRIILVPNMILLQVIIGFQIRANSLLKIIHCV